MEHGISSPAQSSGRSETTLGRALTLAPTCAKDPRGALRLHRVPENPIAQVTQELRKAGLDEATAQTPHPLR